MLRLLTRLLWKLSGWHIESLPPRSGKFILLIAPHTSNWDFVVLYLLKESQGFKAAWMGKHTLFNIPILGCFFRWTGGIPIDRTASQNTVSVMTARFSETSNLMLTLAPEGRRRHAPHWRSGFYRIARAAQVPLCLGYMDYPSKSVGFSPLIHLSGALKDDMNQIRAFYEGKRGKRPQNAAPIRLRDETTI
ncbi:MAG: 1-acyl-sn-glycerol-3-phosphate acyltransferase [Acidobacteria bacterium]|nr:1-acyl-sn-glycerol-3-phosphate acyltransferase [Acidobacteriota bacterium]